jgi:hypothetical protein
VDRRGAAGSFYDSPMTTVEKEPLVFTRVSDLRMAVQGLLEKL